MSRFYIITVTFIYAYVVYTTGNKLFPWGERPHLSGAVLEPLRVVLNRSKAVVIEIHYIRKRNEIIRQNNYDHVAYEIGILSCTIHLKYREMLDRYLVSLDREKKLFTIEILMYLEEVEHIYYEIEHFVNMLHETERKFGVYTARNQTFVERLKTTVKNQFNPHLVSHGTKKPKRKKKTVEERMAEYINRLYTTKKKSTRDWWPLEYGWEIDYHW